MARVFIQTEALAKMVKSEDLDHPVISVVADMWPEKQALIEKHWRSLDAMGVNSYQGLTTLTSRMEYWKKPYFVTEWQFSLADKDEKNPWAGFVEPSSGAKDASAKSNYQNIILKQPGRVLGSYFFYWNKSKTGTASLHAPFLSDDRWQPVVRTMSQLWRGKVPKNRAPQVSIAQPSGVFRCKPGAQIQLDAMASDRDRGDRVELRYEVLPNDPSKRFVGDFEQSLGVLESGVLTGKKTVLAPKEPGLYRIVFVATDSKGAAYVDSRSFLVE